MFPSTGYLIQLIGRHLLICSWWPIFFFLFSSPVFCQQTLIQRLLSQALQQKLHEETQWKTLLYYQTSWLGGTGSLIDSQDFFLAPEGKINAKLELIATLKHFVLQKNVKEEKNQPQCRYPARNRWLRHKLPLLKQLPTASCPHLKGWLEMADADRVSLVFSSYHLNNPSSMMGHTLLRFHRQHSNPDHPSSAFLDNTVHFSATPTSTNPFIYSVKGLIGFFHGQFTFTRYYLKIQEYNNSENRDLWEYELNLSKTQVEMLLYSFWEINGHSINYYYADDNCSYVLLYLLQAGNPAWNLTPHLSFPVTPANTLRVFHQKPEWIRQIRYRPAIYSRYLRYAERVEKIQNKQMRKMIEKKDFLAIKNNKNFSIRQKTDFTDSLLEYIAYQEKTAGKKQPEKNKKLYKDLLQYRSTLKLSSNQQQTIPHHTRPDLGHWSQRIGLGMKFQLHKKTMLFEWRPVLHDIFSPSIGYPEELSFEMFKTKLFLFNNKSKISIQSLHLIHILSMTFPRLWIFPKAWQFMLGFDRTKDRISKFHLVYGIGLSYRAHGFYGYTMPLIDTGWLSYESSQAFYLATGVEATLLRRLSDSWQYGLSIRSLWNFLPTRRAFFHPELTSILSHAINPRWEVRIKVNITSSEKDFAVKLYHYF